MTRTLCNQGPYSSTVRYINGRSKADGRPPVSPADHRFSTLSLRKEEGNLRPRRPPREYLGEYTS